MYNGHSHNYFMMLSWSLNELRSVEWHILFYFLFYFVFLGLYPWHMEVPRLGVELELQVPDYASVTATWDPSHVCDLHHSSQQCQILNLLSKVRDQTCILMDTSRVHYCWTITETPWHILFLKNQYGVPVMVQQKQIRLGSMRLQVQSLASLGGLKIQGCCELWCRLQTRLGSRVAVALAWAGGYSSYSTPSLGTSIRRGNSPRNSKKTKKKIIIK